MIGRLLPILPVLLSLGCRGPDRSSATSVGPAAVAAPATSTSPAPAVQGPLAEAARAICAEMSQRTARGFAWDSTGIRIRRIADTMVPLADYPKVRAGCGLEITGGERPDQLSDGALNTFIPGEDWGPEPGFGADGPDGSQFAVRRPGAYCVVGEEWASESDDPADSLLPPPTPFFTILIRCAGADPIPPEWGATEPPLFDGMALGERPARSGCYRSHGVSVLLRPLPGIGADRITVRPTHPTSCDPTPTEGDYEIPIGMLPRFLGLKDGIIFLETGQPPRIPELVLIDGTDHRLIYQGPAAAMVGFGPGGAIGVYRPASLAVPHPLCERMNIDLPRIDSLFWVDIHSGRARFAGQTHCPSYQ